MAEWFKAHAWKACVANPHRGFESLSLRQLPLHCRIVPHCGFRPSRVTTTLELCESEC